MTDKQERLYKNYSASSFINFSENDIRIKQGLSPLYFPSNYCLCNYTDIKQACIQPENITRDNPAFRYCTNDYSKDTTCPVNYHNRSL